MYLPSRASPGSQIDEFHWIGWTRYLGWAAKSRYTDRNPACRQKSGVINSALPPPFPTDFSRKPIEEEMDIVHP